MEFRYTSNSSTVQPVFPAALSSSTSNNSFCNFSCFLRNNQFLNSYPFPFKHSHTFHHTTTLQFHSLLALYISFFVLLTKNHLTLIIIENTSVTIIITIKKLTLNINIPKGTIRSISQIASPSKNTIIPKRIHTHI